ncbi:MAG: hypothetical protein LBQ13_03145 [Endomicrobium sp.]|jgi:hypothetical protein|nr:hypothetical protein [Endomicrobium sp.]
MKRKSILMTIVAVFFAGIAIGQVPNLGQPWPAAGTLPNGAKSADTIYFCEPADSLRPIELGYDVLGLSLLPSFGDWSLYSRTSSAALPSDYDFGVQKNQGQGNAFKVVGSTVGGYIFQYIATDGQCGLAVGEAFYAYVFILPDLNDALSKDTIVCTQSSPGFSVNVKASFYSHVKDYGNLYDKAGVAFSLLPATWDVKVEAPFESDSVYEATLTIDPANSPKEYTCGLSGKYLLKVKVRDSIDFDPKTHIICVDDTVGIEGQRNPDDIFKRQVPGGSYSPATIFAGGWTADEVANGKQFLYSYTDPCTSTPKTVKDTLRLDGKHGYWGKDTVTVCRTKGLADILNDHGYYDALSYPGINGLPQPADISYWYDRGTTGTFPVLPGTKSGNSSLVGSHTINLDDMLSSIGYNYLWRIDPAASFCLGGDSGMMVVILQEALSVVDYRAQMCTNALTSDFDLALFTGIKNAAWKHVAYAPITISDDKILANDLSANLGIGTHKFSYKIGGNCSAEDSAVFYLKITDKVKISTSVTEKYCKDNLPASINLNDLLGLVDASPTWALQSAEIDGGTIAQLTDIVGFTANGVLDIGKLANSPGFNGDFGSSDQVKLVFTLTGTGCGHSGSTVTLDFSKLF